MSGWRAVLFGLVSGLRRRLRFRLYRAHLAWVLRRVPAAPPARRVLLLRTDLIGDFLLWHAAGCALVEHYRAQGYQVVVVLNADCVPLAEQLGLGDAIWPLERRRFLSDLGYRGALLRQVAAAGFAEVVQTRYSREGFIDDGLVAASRAARRVDFAAECFNLTPGDRARSDRCYTERVPAGSDACMELERNARLVRAFTGQAFLATRARWPADPARLPAILAQRAYLVVFPGASDDAKCWPVTDFAAVAAALRAEFGLAVVIAGGAGDRRRATELASRLAPGVIDLCGGTTLAELAEVLRTARLLLSNDTAAAHLGAVVGTPVVCIAGGWHARRFLPYPEQVADERPLPVAVAHPMACWGCNRQCVYPVPHQGPFRCIAEVPQAAVLDAARALLS